MPRDFRPKGQGQTARKRQERSNRRGDEDEVSEDVFREQVAALGGTDEDIALMESQDGPKPKLSDAELGKELMAFMAKENMPTKGLKQGTKVKEEQEKPKVERQQKKAKDVKGKEPMGKRPMAEESKSHSSVPKPSRPTVPAASTGSNKHVVFDGDDDAPKVVEPSSLRLLIEPSSNWVDILRPELKPTSVPAEASQDVIASLHELGKQVLDTENDIYARLASGEAGRNVILGSMNFSDLQFARTLLSSSKASTLSDRISAVTLLLQSSPVHNLKALDLLMNMSGKSNREEASRATRALADWFAMGGGLSSLKLNYFRDQPALREAAGVYKGGVTDALKVNVCLWAFEDLLKRTYFAFVQLLERQSHDTLLFMRRQAVTQVFVLLRDKPEQEHNLLRVLTNKLGDPDRSVASKASTHLMELLQVHPAMKAIVLREVSEIVLRSQHGSDEHAKGNQHATYYGVLTLNQTLFVESDAPLANEIFSIYFQLFDVCLKEEQAEESKEAKPEKKRWRDANKQSSANKQASDVYNRLLAGILTGVRRVFPFTTLTTEALDAHLETLFRITHTHSFNIAIQALQLIFQVAVGSSSDGESARGYSPQVVDRYYRILYDSMLDSRVATTSKQAMYLNLMYKSIKADVDEERVKAMVKRLCQVLNLQEPPFIVGALVLLGELFKAKPGLRAMLTEPEEESVEQFHDVDEEAPAKSNVSSSTLLYDGRKRDPRFAHAGDTALWDLLPLTRHFHPSVSLNTQQLLSGDKVTSNADLTLNTLMHFLDRFVFKNPKKRSPIKGSSIMQPSLSDAADTLLKRTAAPLSYVNSAEFWTQRPEDIPVDQQFFHQYFQTKLKRSQAQPEADTVRDDVDVHDESEDEAEDDLSTDDEEEKEIWKAMKSSMPSHEEMADLNDEDDEDDDELIAQLRADADQSGDDDKVDEADEDEETDDDDLEEGADSEFDDGDWDAPDDTVPSEQDEEDDNDMFLEDEDDLLPFTDFDAEEAKQTAGQKRSADDESGKGKSKRSKRQALPAFASADDYAHMLDSDDEGN